MPPLAGQVSVVVQGPIFGKSDEPATNRLTYRCLQSIRQALPGTEVILSTWKGSDISGLPFDRLVENDDPGGPPYVGEPHIRNNVNRQIVSSRNGILATSRPWVLKMRSDMLMTGTGFLDYADAFPARNDLSFLGTKVVVSTIYSRLPRFGLVRKYDRHGGRSWRDSPQVVFGFPYHPSDWFHFGRREDVLDIWDVALASEPEMTQWFVDRPRPANDVWPDRINRYVPEQHIWLSFLRKRTSIRCDHAWDVSPETVAGSERSYAGNLVMISPSRAGFEFANRPLPAFSHGPVDWLLYGAGSCYTHGAWKEIYARECLGRPISVASLHRARALSLRWTYRALVKLMAARVTIATLRGRAPRRPAKEKLE